MSAGAHRIATRSLVITACPPPDPAKDVHGIYRRLALFVSALSDVSEHIEMLHLVPPDWRSRFSSADALQQEQSNYWGTSVKVTTVSQRQSPREWWRYLLAPFSISQRPRFSVSCGPQQLKALRDRLSDSQSPVDMIFVHRLAGAVPFLKIRAQLPPVFFDLDDIEHRVKWRSALASRSPLGRISSALQVPAIYRTERQTVEQARQTFVCSEEDRRYLIKAGMPRTITVIPNAVAAPASAPPLSSDATILFLGGYQYEPNAEAAQRLIVNIWPRIRQQVPHATLIIAGAEPQKIPAFAISPTGVEFTNFVQDLSVLYERSRIVCSPISIGGGTRVKLIEAAMWGKPIVSTTIGAEGLSLQNDVDILIRDDDESIAEECIRLLSDDRLCDRLSQAARVKAMATYELGAIRRQISNVFIRGVGAIRQ